MKILLINNQVVLAANEVFTDEFGVDCCCGGDTGQCWNVCTVCPCSGDGETVYLPFNCNGQPNSGYFLAPNAKCYQVGAVVHVLPPGAIVLVAVQTVASCQACCGCPSAAFCAGTCPTSYTLVVPAFTMLISGGGGTCTVPVPQKVFPIAKGPSCSWSGVSSFFDVLATCPDFQLPLTVQEDAQMICVNDPDSPTIRRWQIMAGIGPGSGGDTGQAFYLSTYPALPFQCPQGGGFVKVSGDTWMPPLVNLQ